MAVLCFRVAPQVDGNTRAAVNEELNDLKRRLVEATNSTGEAYLTNATLKGHVSMRLAVGNVLTTERHLTTVMISSGARPLTLSQAVGHLPETYRKTFSRRATDRFCMPAWYSLAAKKAIVPSKLQA